VTLKITRVVPSIQYDLVTADPVRIACICLFFLIRNCRVGVSDHTERSCRSHASKATDYIVASLLREEEQIAATSLVRGVAGIEPLASSE
jgi:hypothetical protein